MRFSMFAKLLQNSLHNIQEHECAVFEKIRAASMFTHTLVSGLSRR
jgi:nitrate reductase assembly molybdenum cofactor insertion protein NarJ